MTIRFHIQLIPQIELWSTEVKNIQAPIFMAIGDAHGARYEHTLALLRAKGGGKIAIQVPDDKPLPLDLISRMIAFRKKENTATVKRKR